MERKRKKKLVLGAAFATVVAFSILFMATQYIAYVFGYQDALGAPVAVYEGTPFYWPWQSILWAVGFGQRFPTPFLRAYGLIGLALFLIAMLTIGARRRWRHNVPEFGKEKWGTKAQAAKAGLFAERGVVCGLFDDKLMIYAGPEHQLLSGASRSGKGVGHVIPTLLSWHQSVVVYDIKNELHGDTAGCRSRFSDVIRFNPTDPDSFRFNPLLEVRRGTNEIRDVQNIVEIIADPSGNRDDQNIWDENAKQFLVALILHVLYTAEDGDKNLAGVRARLLDFDGTIDNMMHTGHRRNAAGEPEVHPEIARVAHSLATKSERFRSSVKGTAEGYLTLYADETVAANTATSDFQLGDVMCNTNPVSLYIQPPPSDQARLRPLIRLLINQLCRALMEHKDKDSRGRLKHHNLLLCMDEFPTLGRLDFFQTNMGQMAGYGIKALLIVQSFNHIERAYGADNVIIDNCHVLIAFASADTRTQDRISQMTGESREYRLSYSQPRSLFGGSRHSITQGEQQRRLLQPGDVRELDPRQQLVFVTGYPPFKTDKLRFFEHDALRTLTDIAPPNDDRAGFTSLAANDWAGAQGTGAVASEAEGDESEAEDEGGDRADYHGSDAEPEADDDEFMI